jgi:hypothetical protein
MMWPSNQRQSNYVLIDLKNGKSTAQHYQHTWHTEPLGPDLSLEDQLGKRCSALVCKPDICVVCEREFMVHGALIRLTLLCKHV